MSITIHSFKYRLRYQAVSLVWPIVFATASTPEFGPKCLHLNAPVCLLKNAALRSGRAILYLIRKAYEGTGRNYFAMTGFISFSVALGGNVPRRMTEKRVEEACDMIIRLLEPRLNMTSMSKSAKRYTRYLFRHVLYGELAGRYLRWRTRHCFRTRVVQFWSFGSYVANSLPY